MRIYDLSGHPLLPCFVLKYEASTIMLDCSLDVTSTLCYLPMGLVPPENCTEAKNLPRCIKEINGKHFIDDEPKFITPDLDLFDLGHVDVILISGFRSALALPFVTKYTNFRGVIYATEPTMNLSKLLMEELVESIKKIPRVEEQPSSLSLPSLSVKTSLKDPEIMNLFSSRVRNNVFMKDWKRIYNSFDVESCMSKFKVIGLNEVKEIPGGLRVQSLSSGVDIGACNWLISSPYHKFGYVSNSSKATTHVKQIEEDPFKSCDVLILGCLSPIPFSNTDNLLGVLLKEAITTVKNGGNALISCCTVGVLYDLLSYFVKNHKDLPQMYCLSPVAKSSLSYAGIYSEWLKKTKQDKSFSCEDSFVHVKLLKDGKLLAFPRCYTDEFSKKVISPCIVFACHTSLRFGDGVELMRMWNKSELNCLIVTDPFLNYGDVIAPFKPIIMQVKNCPIDCNLTYAEANKFIKEVAPKNLVVPEKYVLNKKPNSFIEPEFNPITTSRLEVIKLSMKKTFRKAAITPELAQMLSPTEIRPGHAITMMTGSLTCRDSKLTIRPLTLTSNGDKTESIVRPRLAVGQLDIKEFVRKLEEKNLSVKLGDLGEGSYAIELPDALIRVESESTKVSCNNQKTRIIIRDTLLECIPQLT